ncbi:MAG TPA: aminotransferase class V-fold PLP-dependent enzyme [Phycisphaerales bacterium]
MFSRVLSRSGIYLANHSLGRPLDLMSRDVQAALDAWYLGMDEAWGPWLDELATFRNNIACLVGCSRADAVVPKTSAGQGLRAVLNALPAASPRILATRGEFDSIDFILKTYRHRRRAEVTWIEPQASSDGPPQFPTDDLITTLERQSFDLLVVSPVFYATGQLLDDLPGVIAAAHAKKTLVLLDCYHAAGVIPLAIESLGADFAIGGSYKYTRGGPGACWLMVHPRHLRDEPDREPPFRTLDTGWFAKRDTFRFERPEQPLLALGGEAWMEATPAILPLYQAKSGLELTLALGVERLREYSLEQLELLDTALRRRGVHVCRGGSSPAQSGAYLLVSHADATGFCDRLKARGVIADARLGHARFAPDMLTTRDELARAAEIIAETFAPGATA